MNIVFADYSVENVLLRDISRFSIDCIHYYSASMLFCMFDMTVFCRDDKYNSQQNDKDN